MCTILVTGATGNVGRYVIPALQKAGFRVRGQYNRMVGLTDDVDWLQMNFLESWDFSTLVKGCDAVVHLAAELKDVSRMDPVNVEVTRALLAAAQSEGARYFGHASSIVVYGSPRQRAIDEATALLDPHAPMIWQYYSNPHMLNYARTKTLAELAIRNFRPQMSVDFYRPAVVADLDRLLEVGNWSFVRKLCAAHRRTQYIYAPDAAAAIAHLVTRGLAPNQVRPRIEAFNISDENCGTFRDVLATAYRVTGNPRYKLKVQLPVPLDLARYMMKYRKTVIRYPLGMLKFANEKLLATGFTFPTGMKSALEQALVH
jgi:nucleoside-diphosphate-sugar epimerase